MSSRTMRSPSGESKSPPAMSVGGSEVQLGEAVPRLSVSAQAALDHVRDVAHQPRVVGAGERHVRPEPVIEERLAAQVGTPAHRAHQLDSG